MHLNTRRFNTGMSLALLIICTGTLLAVIGSVSIMMPEYAFAQQENSVSRQKSNISVTTDKAEYETGDVVIISGNITTNLADTPVLLQIFRDGNPIHINQITPAQDNTYWEIVRVEGSRWDKTGEYEVNIRYGKDGKAATNFSIVPSQIKNDDITPTESSGRIEVDVGNETFDVGYTITGGSVIDMTLDWRDFTLIVDIETTEEFGSITMNIPREYIGATDTSSSTTADDMFIVQVDGVQVDYSEESNADPSTRDISIGLLKGDAEIRVIGTYAVPEFSHYVMIMLSIAGIMILVILLSKTKKYSNVMHVYKMTK